MLCEDNFIESVFVRGVFGCIVLVNNVGIGVEKIWMKVLMVFVVGIKEMELVKCWEMVLKSWGKIFESGGLFLFDFML